MNILFATSELSPLVKTGGLADMVSALALNLHQQGITVSLALPYYSKIKADTKKVCNISIPMGEETVDGEIHQAQLPSSSVPVYLISQAGYFHRSGVYGEQDEDYPDNLQRYTFFCRGVLELILQSIVPADILHANDWQTGLLPVYLKTIHSLNKIQSVFTIHNLAYQGSFPAELLPLTGIGWEHFHMEALEFYNHINLLKGGIVFADALTTVSPTYAKEIQTVEMGCGLEGVLQQRNDQLTGILNGVDYSTWSPEQDQLIPHPYHADNAIEKKALNKQELLALFEMKENASNRPLFGVVSRLAEQKGLDLLADIVPKLVELDAQLVMLGSGDPQLEEQFLALQKSYPQHCGIRIEYNEKVAHLIEAGTDCFLMPSRYEPCGLNQMYSLRYGSIPVVHSTGGLADTIIDIDINPNGNGFRFNQPSPDALFNACKRAMAYYQQKEVWHALVRRTMQQDFSWNHPAKLYISIYHDLIPAAVSV